MPKTPEELARSFSEDRLTFSRSDHTDWTFIVPAGTPPEALLIPENWEHIAASNKKVKRRDRIHAECEDERWLASYRVQNVGPNHITLKVLILDENGVCWLDTDVESPLEAGQYRVEWIARGEQNLWGVKCIGSKDYEARGLPNKPVAEAWLAEFLEKRAA